MKRFYFQFGVTILTFVIGLLSLWLFNVGNEIVRTLQKGVPVNPDLIEKKTEPKEDNLKIIFKNGIGSVELPKRNYPRFISDARGCGRGGYSQSYFTIEGDRLSEGAWSVTQKQFNKSIKDAKIIEKVENAKNRDGEKGLRIVTKNFDEEGREYFEILWFGKGTLHNITAPTLELALEFEKDKAYTY